MDDDGGEKSSGRNYDRSAKSFGSSSTNESANNCTYYYNNYNKALLKICGCRSTKVDNVCSLVSTLMRLEFSDCRCFAEAHNRSLQLCSHTQRIEGSISKPLSVVTTTIRVGKKVEH